MTLILIVLLMIMLVILLAMASYIVRLKRQSANLLTIFNDNVQNTMLEHSQAEEAKQKLEKALLQGQKLQAIGTLASGIAHDFNNILYAITGYVELAREDVETNSLTYKNLGKALDASHRGQKLISRILAFSRRQQHHDFKPIYLHSTIESVLTLLRPTIPTTVCMHFETSVKDCVIMGEETQLHQVIVNIINNAVDAMNGEGDVTLVLDHIPPHDNILEQFPSLMHTNYCKIEITDTGHGMDQSTMERIFEPFFTTKEVGKGTGLGLATVHNIIEEHKGEIITRSQLGRGTTFTLVLPEYMEDEYGEHLTR